MHFLASQSFLELRVSHPFLEPGRSTVCGEFPGISPISASGFFLHGQAAMQACLACFRRHPDAPFAQFCAGQCGMAGMEGFKETKTETNSTIETCFVRVFFSVSIHLISPRDSIVSSQAIVT